MFEFKFTCKIVGAVDGLAELIRGFFLSFCFFIRFTEAGMKTDSVKPRLTVTMRPRWLGLPALKNHL